MRLTEFYRDGDKVVYYTTINESNYYYFYDGFDNKENAIDTIIKHFNGIFDKRSLLRSGVWSKIIK